MTAGPVSREAAAAIFAEDASWHELHLQAAEYVDRAVEAGIAAGDIKARARGIAPLRAFLKAPSSLGPALDAACYGWTLEERLRGAEAILRWIASASKAAAA